MYSSLVRGCASGTISMTFAVFSLSCYCTKRRWWWWWVMMWRWSIPVHFTAHCQKRGLDALWRPDFTPGDQSALFIWKERILLEKCLRHHRLPRENGKHSCSTFSVCSCSPAIKYKGGKKKNIHCIQWVQLVLGNLFHECYYTTSGRKCTIAVTARSETQTAANPHQSAVMVNKEKKSRVRIFIKLILMVL